MFLMVIKFMKKRWRAVGAVLFFLLAGSLFVTGSGREAGAEPELTASLTDAAGDVQSEAVLPEQKNQNKAEQKNMETTDNSDGEGQLKPETVCAAEKKQLYVHVCGAVLEPGVYTFASGARVVEAILAAGGFAADAARDYLNQARVLADGEKLYVPNNEEAAMLLEESGKIIPEEPASGTVSDIQSTDSRQETVSDARLNINTAALSELMTLTGIGQSKAEAILAYRSEHGDFSSCEELMQVPGIKESLYEKIRDNISTGD